MTALYQVKATLGVETLVVGYGPTYAAALRDCESQFDLVKHLARDCFDMVITNPAGQKFKLSYDEAKKFNF